MYYWHRKNTKQGENCQSYILNVINHNSISINQLNWNWQLNSLAHNSEHTSVYFINNKKENSNVGNRKQPVWTTHCQNNQPVGLFIRNLLSSKSIHYAYEEINIILYETPNYDAKKKSRTNRLLASSK